MRQLDAVSNLTQSLLNLVYSGDGAPPSEEAPRIPLVTKKVNGNTTGSHRQKDFTEKNKVNKRMGSEVRGSTQIPKKKKVKRVKSVPETWSDLRQLDGNNHKATDKDAYVIDSLIPGKRKVTALNNKKVDHGFGVKVEYCVLYACGALEWNTVDNLLASDNVELQQEISAIDRKFAEDVFNDVRRFELTLDVVTKAIEDPKLERTLLWGSAAFKFAGDYGKTTIGVIGEYHSRRKVSFVVYFNDVDCNVLATSLENLKNLF
jgi:hypothetical protein